MGSCWCQPSSPGAPSLFARWETTPPALAGAVLTCCKEERLTAGVPVSLFPETPPQARALWSLLLDRGIYQELLGVPRPHGGGEQAHVLWLYSMWRTFPADWPQGLYHFWDIFSKHSISPAWGNRDFWEHSYWGMHWHKMQCDSHFSFKVRNKILSLTLSTKNRNGPMGQYCRWESASDGSL